MPKAKTQKKTKSKETLEQKLWKSADKLRKNMDAAEYKHIVLGLIFLKYISDAFEVLSEKLVVGEGECEGANLEDKAEYLAENVFFVPETARWSFLQGKGKLPEIGKWVDDAMEAIEQDNPQLKGILPKVYAQQKFDKSSLGGLIDLIGSVRWVGDATATSERLDLDLEGNGVKLKQGDILGRVYEYFLGEFALAEGKKGGQFYTPESIVKVLVEMVEPYEGRVFDPCCGSGGMFVWSEKFVAHHQGRLDDISIYGQESNETTWRLCKMNLAIRGIDTSQIKWNGEGSFLNDSHPDLKADFILANPPFNDSDWSGELLRKDGRWQYGTPPTGNANFAWVQHFLYHLAPTGCAGFVLSNGSLSSNTGGEGEIRRAIVEADLVDCIVMLPTQLFYNTGISACLWFLSRYENGSKYRERKEEILFIDASELGYMVNRRNRAFKDEDIAKIAGTYRAWKLPSSNPSPWEGDRPSGEGSGRGYADIKGFCKSATLAEIEKHNFVLTPGRYVGIPEEEDDGIPFEEKMGALTRELGEQMREGAALDEEIKRQLAKVGFEIEGVE
ncbi:MAG: SAM-dependent DNA methyltransferase [Cyanobacteria bacterium SBLK]|nr:SAM-dependent DNA methyltransferase [Cyanobacteria bacterium SBLK]